MRSTVEASTTYAKPSARGVQRHVSIPGQFWGKNWCSLVHSGISWGHWNDMRLRGEYCVQWPWERIKSLPYHIGVHFWGALIPWGFSFLRGHFGVCDIRYSLYKYHGKSWILSLHEISAKSQVKIKFSMMHRTNILMQIHRYFKNPIHMFTVTEKSGKDLENGHLFFNLFSYFKWLSFYTCVIWNPILKILSML